jgi:hypothetical protein
MKDANPTKIARQIRIGRAKKKERSLFFYFDDLST